MKLVGSLLLLVFLAWTPLSAVENFTDGSYNTTAPTDSDIPGWQEGWGEPGITGWNYVGTDSGASAVYLGNGFVLTAAHVGAVNFTLGGLSYNAGTSYTLSNPVGVSGSPDLTLFQISSTVNPLPSLPALALTLTNPPAYPGTTRGQSVVMIGYGGGMGETWGEDVINRVNQQTNLNNTWNSLDFYTLNSRSGNSYELVSGDSGGGDFIFNSATEKWELAGINEVQLINNNNEVAGSGMVQLSNYDSQIDSIMAAAAPEPPTWLLLALGCMGVAWLRSRRQAPH